MRQKPQSGSVLKRLAHALPAQRRRRTKLPWIILGGCLLLAAFVACAYVAFIPDRLTRSAMAGDAERVRMLLAKGKGPDVSTPAFLTDRFKGWTPLMWALYYAHDEVAIALLDAGANPNHRGWYGETPLDITVLSWNHRSSTPISDHEVATMVRLLLAHGADPSLARGIGSTPLHSAANQGRTEVVRALLEGGAPVNAMSEHVPTPLREAIWSQNPNAEVVRLLLEYGADPAIGDNPEKPLREAIASRRLQLDPEIIRLLEPYLSE